MSMSESRLFPKVRNQPSWTPQRRHFHLWMHVWVTGKTVWSLMNTCHSWVLCDLSVKALYKCTVYFSVSHSLIFPFYIFISFLGYCSHNWNTHNHFTAIFLGLPRWAGARRNLLLDFMVQGKISEADTLTIWLGATASRLISDQPPSSPHFYAWCPQPSRCILASDRHQICWLAYPMAWFS